MNTPKVVLVVDDEPLFVRSLADGMRPLGEREGFLLRTATNGKDAISILQSNTVDLVLTDLGMPGMDGFQLISWMIASRLTVPVVVMTAMPSIEARVQLRQSGWYRVLQKPIELADVHRCIVTELGARRVRVEGLATTAFLQLVAMERVSCVLTVRSGLEVGHMGIIAGDLVHAEIDDRDGLAAAHAVVRLPDAVIEMVEREDIPKSGIPVPLAEVVLDALRTNDELMRDRGRVTATTTTDGEFDIEFDIVKSQRPPPSDTETTPAPVEQASALAASRVPSFPETASRTPAHGVGEAQAGAGARPATGARFSADLSESAAAFSAPPNDESNSLGKETTMDVINVEKADTAVNKLREALGAGLVAADVWNVEDGMPIVGFNSQPIATALFNRITDVISETLSESGFPGLNKHYILDLEGDKIVVVVPLDKYRAGVLIDKKKAQLGVVVSVALPKFVNALEDAIRG